MYKYLRALSLFYHTMDSLITVDEIIQNAFGLERYYVSGERGYAYLLSSGDSFPVRPASLPCAQPSPELMTYTCQRVTGPLKGGNSHKPCWEIVTTQEDFLT